MDHLLSRAHSTTFPNTATSSLSECCNQEDSVPLLLARTDTLAEGSIRNSSRIGISLDNTWRKKISTQGTARFFFKCLKTLRESSKNQNQETRRNPDSHFESRHCAAWKELVELSVDSGLNGLVVLFERATIYLPIHSSGRDEQAGMQTDSRQGRRMDRQHALVGPTRHSLKSMA